MLPEHRRRGAGPALWRGGGRPGARGRAHAGRGRGVASRRSTAAPGCAFARGDGRGREAPRGPPARWTSRSRRRGRRSGVRRRHLARSLPRRAPRGLPRDAQPDERRRARPASSTSSRRCSTTPGSPSSEERLMTVVRRPRGRRPSPVGRRLRRLLAAVRPARRRPTPGRTTPSSCPTTAATGSAPRSRRSTTPTSPSDIGARPHLDRTVEHRDAPHQHRPRLPRRGAHARDGGGRLTALSPPLRGLVHGSRHYG